MVIKGNSNVFQSLRDFYRNLRENDQFDMKDSCRLDINSFLSQLDSFIYDSNMQCERGQHLVGNIAARKAMVGISRPPEFMANPPAYME